MLKFIEFKDFTKVSIELDAFILLLIILVIICQAIMWFKHKSSFSIAIQKLVKIRSCFNNVEFLRGSQLVRHL